jgi:hypothetical protein
MTRHGKQPPPDGIRPRPGGNSARMLRTSRVAVLLVLAAMLGLWAGLIWGSAERLADQRPSTEQTPPAAVIQP